MQLAKSDYSAPWNERLPDGTKLEYGPSPSSYARHLGEFRLWAWRPEKMPSRLARSASATKIREWMRPELPSSDRLRADVPRRELEVYVWIFERGHSVRWVARRLELSRSTVKTYVARLRERAGL